MPLFNVTIEFEVVVEADTADNAVRKANDELHDISINDEPGISAMPVRKVKLPGGERWMLADGYDNDCYPYGGDGEKTIGEILGDY